ncbi:hypothetical protein R1A27_17120 [Methylobacterium sp. NMS12]|uniref:hypothetical protein n=1 Tax=Methylobacterium sp. NMS12 TaxID=3079766 RepID=UPI003F88511E
MTELMRALAADIASAERAADHLAALARRSDASGDLETAETLAHRARERRVVAITQRARLEVLVERYGALHLD